MALFLHQSPIEVLRHGGTKEHDNKVENILGNKIAFAEIIKKSCAFDESVMGREGEVPRITHCYSCGVHPALAEPRQTLDRRSFRVLEPAWSWFRITVPASVRN
jgi:hypothetical protein